MKILMIYCDLFAYRPTLKTLEGVEDVEGTFRFESVQVIFIHAEESDEKQENEVITKLLKNIKWVCGKNQTKKVILHSFAHLSSSKADPMFTKQLLDKVEVRLQHAGYEVSQTPYGYFLDLEVRTPGFSLARVFKEL